jgi:hypothetical protein
MSARAACLIVAAAVLAAIGASVLMRRVLDSETRRRHHDAGSAFFLQLGVLFAVLLAFVFSEVWSEYNTAAQAINLECGALHGAAMMAQALPAPQAERVEKAILAYVDSVRQAEWRTMASRRASPDALRALTVMMSVATHLDAARPGDLAIRSEVLSLLSAAHAERETRIFQMTQGLPVMLWIVLLLYTVILVACVLGAGVDSAPGHALLAGAFAGCVVMVLVTIRMLDYPFEGALALGDADFVEAGRNIAAQMGGA